MFAFVKHLFIILEVNNAVGQFGYSSAISGRAVAAVRAALHPKRQRQAHRLSRARIQVRQALALGDIGDALFAVRSAQAAFALNRNNIESSMLFNLIFLHMYFLNGVFF